MAQEITFNKWKHLMLDWGLKNTGPGNVVDLNLHLLMTNSECATAPATARDYDKIADFTTLDICDSTGYAAKLNVPFTVVADEANDRAIVRVTTAVQTWASLAADASRAIHGLLAYLDPDPGDTNEYLLCYKPFAIARVPDGNNFDVTIGSGASGDIYYLKDDINQQT
jgi:hypothetical protein